MNRNQLEGTVPREIGELTQLVSVYMGQNKLDGEVCMH
jgi:hypothetical protein